MAGLQIGTGERLTIAVLHGDQTSGGDPNYLAWLGIEIAKRLPDATVHMLLRPGYADPWGRRSPGENFDRRDQYTMENATRIADSLRALDTGAPMIVVGHSGGAAQTALALSLGELPIDEAILVGCPCDLALWQAANPSWPDDMFTRSTSAIAVIPDTAARVSVIVGENDAVTPAEQSRSYVNHLKEHGVDARLIETPGGDHMGNRALSSAWLQSELDAAHRLVN
ncbi:MAG: hypothetical protein AAFX45_02050 [Pseudomonadota bacterium]